MKIEEMADIFLDSANFAPHAFLTLVPVSSYALNLKALIKVLKVSCKSQLSNELFRSSFQRKFHKTKFISPKKTPFRVKRTQALEKMCILQRSFSSSLFNALVLTTVHIGSLKRRDAEGDGFFGLSSKNLNLILFNPDLT